MIAPPSPSPFAPPETQLVGARTHNLAGVDLVLRPGEVTVFAGVSGAGKSSLALDTLYAEGQRRFVESFTPYARQFLERLERPPVTRLDPIPAGIAVDRKAPIKSSRSTLATMADLEPYLAALFAREARPRCPEHGALAVPTDAKSGAERVLAEVNGERAHVTYARRAVDTEAYLSLRDALSREGRRRLWLGGAPRELDQVRPSEALESPEGVEVVVDRLRVDARDRSRLAAALEEAFRQGAGEARVHTPERTLRLREGLACPECGRAFEAPRPAFFSYESPLGACTVCRGFGRTLGVDWGKVFPDATRSLAGGAIRPWSGRSTQWERKALEQLCARHGVSLETPWGLLPEEHRRVVIEGDGGWTKRTFPGVRGWFEWLESRTYKMHVRVLLARYRSYDPCSACGGKRLAPHALAYAVDALDLAEWHQLEVGQARRRLAALEARTGQGELARRELATRLEYLERVGLGYLSLDRPARTLSGGEAQRVTLTAALGTQIHNALFVLDEPTVGLHALDVAPLREMLRELAGRGNTVVVVEHDAEILRGADRVVELGPSAGAEGGRIVADGSPEEVRRTGGATARALGGVTRSERRLRHPRAHVDIVGATENNLRDVSVRVPLGVLCVVAGPSGSGKSTLAVELLHHTLARRLGRRDVDAPGACREIRGLDRLQGVELVDQAPLGRTSRGNAATYTKAWDEIRKRFASTPEAAHRGLGVAHFSFNVDGGRCEACAGEGWETVEMQFLADVRLICPTCQGRRFKSEVLAVRYRGRSVAELLDGTVTEALRLFADAPGISRALGPLEWLGLGYLRLGQPLTTLSGGEAQRLKLARALSSVADDVLFILDEPSAGLHADEVGRVIGALDQLVAGGGSVLVVDHDLDLVRAADWVVELGPGAGALGGTLVAEGPPGVIARAPTRTGEALRNDAALRRAAPRGRAAKAARAEPPRAARAPRDRALRKADTANDGAAPGSALAVVRAREHNLRDVTVRIPHGRLSVITGPSGSGKSTLAFDVIFAEGQRRFLETLSPYARQFLPTLPRPDVDQVIGVPPAIALEQRTTRAGGSSTVATVTEVAHYLRLLWAKLGTPHCPTHDRLIAPATVESIVAAAARLRGDVTLLAPVVRSRKGQHFDVFTNAVRAGVLHARVDGVIVSTDSPPLLRRSREHDIDLLIASTQGGSALDAAAVERALGFSKGEVKLRVGRHETLLSTNRACPECAIAVPELDPRWFSFSTAQGRCPECEGAGVVVEQHKRRGKEPELVETPCAACLGTRLAPVPRAVRLGGERFPAFVARDVRSARARLDELSFEGTAARIAEPVMAELVRRLDFLLDVGLDYLSLDRRAATLSGGEMQRLRLAAQLGAGLSGALYVLDEPTIGLHPRDTRRLLGNLRSLVALGSTVVVVEHDAETIRAADHLVDLGPAGGTGGGRVVAEGTPAEVLATPGSPTGRALASPAPLRQPLPVSEASGFLRLEGARAHNLAGASARFALGRFNVVAGVSGSGKSTLVQRVLLPAVRRALGLVAEEPGAHDRVTGHERLRRALAVDQSPIGRTPRSVPATFLGIWDTIRTLYARAPEAQVEGFAKARFSFNTPSGGRCPACAGQGVVTHEMSFLPDVTTPCAACGGQRFEPRTLSVRWLERTVGEVLDLSAEEAVGHFAAHPDVARPLATLVALGAGYVRLGQGSHTLSGGEAQRLKLAAELTATARHEPTLYVLDEPTTGLHVADVSKLVSVLERLVERGDTLIVIEHHPTVLAGADWVVELGPEGGRAGGRVVAEGTPAEVAQGGTATAPVLRAELEAAGRGVGGRARRRAR